ncbi:MAG: C25 family cysteine peptidase [Saprospiraceae bacterium]|nr:C25 family cysteine peptidase [Saprospiraceae bacterium]
MFNDTAAYYLTWESGSQNPRYNAVNNDLNNLPPAEPFCFQTARQEFAQGFFKKRIADEIQYSWFDGAGFTRASSASVTPVTLTLPQLFPNGPDPVAHVRYACNNGDHHQQIWLNDSLFAEDQFSDFRIVDRSFTVGGSFVQSGATFKLLSPIGDRNGLVFASLRYPRFFNFDNAQVAQFELDASTPARYLEIQGFDAAGGAPVLWDIDARMRVVTQLEAGLVKVKLPAEIGPRRCRLIAPNAVKSVPAMQAVQFQPLDDAADINYLIISNPVLFAEGVNEVEAYADYRRSAAGGSHQVKVVNIGDLYEQFGYGVRFHPIALRNFMHWAKKQWPACEHALIIGKALDMNQFRSNAQQQTFADSLFLVPTFSVPGADLPFVMQGARLTQPIMAIGRLAVTEAAQIRDYLDKVILHEQQPALAGQTLADKAWMKRVIHNSGGLSGESGLIRNYTTDMANTLANNMFGAEVHSFYKTSDDPVQLSAYEQLLDLMNQGVSVWSIFGHSSAFTVDFDIGLPNAYDNYGRYPLMLIMGCFSGQCSLTQPGIGESFVLAPDRGAIAYIASVHYSFVDALHQYARQYYQRIGGDDYGKSVGLSLVHTVNDLKSTQNAGLIGVLHQNLLQGDPAVRLHTHEGPDFLVDPQSVIFTPNPAGLEQATLKLKFDAVNIGKNNGGTLALNIEQRLPDQTMLARILDTIPAPPNRSTLEYEVPLNGSKVGFNRFFVTLDPANLVQESPSLAETNNELSDATGERGMEVYIYADDVAPVYPLAFGIVGAPATLYASTLNTSAKTQRYLFEIDTLETFDTPLKQSAQLTAAGGLLSWKPPINWQDSAVYYWRIARDTLVNGALLWRQRSFIYLSGGSPGWNQSDYGQYRENTLTNLQCNDTTRQIAFSDNAAFVSVQVAYRGVNRYPGLQNSYYENFLGDFGWNQQGVSRGVAIAVADPNTGRLILNPAGGPFNYDPPKDRYFFWFDTRDSLQRQKAMNFIEQGIPDGHYAGLLAFNTPTDQVGYAPQMWALDSVSSGKNLFQVLESQGAQKVRELANFAGAPPAYGLVFRKNDNNYPARDTIVSDPNQVADVRANFLARWSVGYMESPPIGPVKNWETLYWQHGEVDHPSDRALLSVIAVREGRPDSVLYVLDNEMEFPLDAVSVNEFPQLKLRYEVADTLLRSATPLQYARIQFQPLPEGALRPVAHFNFERDTLQQGERLRSSVAFYNISGQAFDSLTVQYKINNQQGNGGIYWQKYRPLPPGDSAHLTFSAPTLSISGPQQWLVDVNPGNAQPEQYHFNNVMLHDFYVGRDQRNPLLDVTFDGQHLLDGDLVSPKPVVILTLKDENRYLAMSDSATFQLNLQYPDGSSRVILPNDPDVLFFPADATNLPKSNLARLEWRPVLEQDGEYLLSVNGRDASGNESGSLDWSARFRVITKSSLSNLLNYPNPFSTSTCFVYTLTGSESPAHFKIQIMTVSGRVVREITEQEFGPLKPGVHRSDFCWDGRDEFGDPLAKGVYLYRVVAKKADGSDFELFNNDSVDGFFRHGFGKMVKM